MELQQLQEKLQEWQKVWPAAVKEALIGGSNLVAEEIKRRWSGGELQKRTGRLVGAVKTEVKTNPIHARVYVDQKQQYKAQTFEYGKTIVAKGTSRKSRKRKPGKEPFMQIRPSKYGGGYYFGRPKQVHISARPVFAPSLNAKRKEVVEMILRKVMEAYRRV